MALVHCKMISLKCPSIFLCDHLTQSPVIFPESLDPLIDSCIQTLKYFAQTPFEKLAITPTELHAQYVYPLTQYLHFLMERFP